MGRKPVLVLTGTLLTSLALAGCQNSGSGRNDQPFNPRTSSNGTQSTGSNMANNQTPGSMNPSAPGVQQAGNVPGSSNFGNNLPAPQNLVNSPAPSNAGFVPPGPPQPAGVAQPYGNSQGTVSGPSLNTSFAPGAGPTANQGLMQAGYTAPQNQPLMPPALPKNNMGENYPPTWPFVGNTNQQSQLPPAAPGMNNQSSFNMPTQNVQPASYQLPTQNVQPASLQMPANPGMNNNTQTNTYPAFNTTPTPVPPPSMPSMPSMPQQRQ